MSLPIKLSLVLLVSFLMACSVIEEKESTKLKHFVESKGFAYESFHSILLITEYGCPQCNKSFASLMTQQQENPKMLYVVSARGTFVDISGLFEFKNVLKDFQNEFKTLSLTNKSSCIFLDDKGEIDTLVEINAKGLESSLAYISNRLND